jgi:hypothetical protein
MPAFSVDKKASLRLATYGLGVMLLQALQVRACSLSKKFL